MITERPASACLSSRSNFNRYGVAIKPTRCAPSTSSSSRQRSSARLRRTLRDETASQHAGSRWLVRPDDRSGDRSPGWEQHRREVPGRQVERSRKDGFLAGEVDSDLPVGSKVGRFSERGVRTRATSTLRIGIATTTATAEESDQQTGKRRDLRANGVTLLRLVALVTTHPHTHRSRLVTADHP